ncbi:MAG: MFS transporter [Bacteroidaceae bacterium]|nr:MFS transporter [Bacteroidaceae bacterium]
MNTTTNKMTNYRWVICAMLFLATTVNYMDRQVLSLTWKDFIAIDFHWSDADYGFITAAFSIFYAFISLFAGKFIDWMGTKKGYIWAIVIWSIGACLHAICGVVTMSLTGIPDEEALRAVKAGTDLALLVSTISVWLFLACRIVLATGEAGNFPAAIKVTAEFFPKKDRALATSIFNAGASVGALAAPLTIPVLAESMGWEMAFIIIGGVGFIWAILWAVLYNKPTESKRVNAAELAYIQQDSNAPAETEKTSASAPTREQANDNLQISFFKCFTYRQTWAFIVGKLLTDGVWWFFLFWAPAYFSELGYKSSDPMGQALIFVLYLIVTVVSIGGGYLPKFFVEQKNMEPYSGRMLAMLIFAFFPIFAMFAQPLAGTSVWWPCIIIGLAGAGHQSWSANLYSTIGDMFPKSAIASITGIGTMFGGLCSFAINWGSGLLFTYAEGQGEAFQFFGVTGKPAGYMIVFCYCAVAYLIAWALMKVLVPKYKPITK